MVYFILWLSRLRGRYHWLLETHPLPTQGSNSERPTPSKWFSRYCPLPFMVVRVLVSRWARSTQRSTTGYFFVASAKVP